MGELRGIPTVAEEDQHNNGRIIYTNITKRLSL